MSLRMMQLLLVKGTEGDPTSDPVQIADLQAKLRELGSTTQVAAADAARPALGAIVVAGVVAVAAVYLLGKRRGRRQASILQIKRV